VHEVSGSAQSIAEGEAPIRQALCVMKEQYLSHLDAPYLVFEFDIVVA
jgi:hypothetical protein